MKTFTIFLITYLVILAIYYHTRHYSYLSDAAVESFRFRDKFANAYRHYAISSRRTAYFHALLALTLVLITDL